MVAISFTWLLELNLILNLKFGFSVALAIFQVLSGHMKLVVSTFGSTDIEPSSSDVLDSAAVD